MDKVLWEIQCVVVVSTAQYVITLIPDMCVLGILIKSTVDSPNQEVLRIESC